MVDTLPATIDPLRLADKGARICGHLSLQALPRLRAGCSEGSGGVDVDLEFGRDPDGRRYMRSRLEAMLPLQCQRCLGAISTPVQVDSEVFLLSPQQSEPPAEADWLRVEGSTSLRELVEDELLLALPMMPMHSDPGCAGGDTRAEDAEQRANPFAVLNQLKRRDR